MIVSFAAFGAVPLPTETGAITLQPGPPHYHFTDEEFEQFCAEHHELRVEMNIESGRDYSNLSATIGSTFVARRAGM